MKDTKKATITFRITNEMKAKLEALAVKEKRTVSNLIEVLLDKAIESMNKTK